MVIVVTAGEENGSAVGGEALRELRAWLVEGDPDLRGRPELRASPPRGRWGRCWTGGQVLTTVVPGSPAAHRPDIISGTVPPSRPRRDWTTFLCGSPSRMASINWPSTGVRDGSRSELP
jgi:hypothetical protein